MTRNDVQSAFTCSRLVATRATPTYIGTLSRCRREPPTNSNSSRSTDSIFSNSHQRSWSTWPRGCEGGLRGALEPDVDIYP